MSIANYSWSASSYRFGFNGQEKSPEIAEGHYTAEFWEYDSKSARRWNTDPVKKPWQSDYAVLSNTPIWKIDPNGDDDFFNLSGKFLYSDGKSTRTIHIVNTKGVKIQLKNYAFSKDNAKTLANIGAYYAKSAGINVSGLGGGSLSVGNRKWVSNASGQESTEVEDLYNRGSISTWLDIMNHNEQTNRISFSLDNGKIDPLLNDGNNMISSLVHENNHKLIPNGDGFEHLKVYYNQIVNDSFGDATEEFKSKMFNNIRELISQATNYTDKTLTKEQLSAIRKEGTKWKGKFEAIGIRFGTKKK